MGRDLCSCGNGKDARARVCRECFEKNPPQKLCRGCNRTLDASYFSLRRNNTILRSRCKECEAETSRKLRRDHPEICKARKKKWEQSDCEGAIRFRVRNRAKILGLDPEVIYQEYLKHNKCCDICGKSQIQSLAIDPCHTLGVFRGFLCSNCNNGLGRFKDNIDTLEAAIQYLKSTSGKLVPHQPQQT